MAVILLGNLEQYRKGPPGYRPGVNTVPIGGSLWPTAASVRSATPEIAESRSDQCPRPRDTLVLVPFGIAAELAAAVSKRGHELDIVLLEERPHMDMERIGRRQLISRCVKVSQLRLVSKKIIAPP
jgi:hypothetical protein